MPIRLICSTLICLAFASIAPAAPPTTAALNPFEFEVTVDTSDAPDMAAYGKRVKELLELWYPKIVAELPSKDFRPARKIQVVIKNRDSGVAETSGAKIVATAQWFRDRPDDIGAFVHELTHIVQDYRKGERPGWLVEGIADHVRWFQFEPEAKRPHPNAEKSKFSDSYQTSAHFLHFVEKNYDKELIAHLNAACREGSYNEKLWRQLTKKSLDELGAEWKKSLAPEK